ncbi:ATP synthase F1 subunit gamma [Sphingomonas melonis]|uniref:ATP synthase gamma chain n=1 Tax=Sphingomonas melonis TaxID=152682 RepID=A0A0D1MIA9_9SPHN|nr:ATP synthase F1 subunit gamma [Sphingomonas melonis]KIU27356.1 ATP synthase F0F1 subunit gamma [Sphingomonas melonis]
MASLKALKIRINSVKSTQKITKAMKMVAAAKLRRAQEAAQAGRPYAERLEAVVASLSRQLAGGAGVSPLLSGTGKDQVHLLVVATSERGLAGAFNSNIVRAARRKAEELEAQGKTVRFYLAGKKGRVLRRFYPNAILADHELGQHKVLGFQQAREVADDLLARYAAGEFDVAHLFYAKFVSALVQLPVGRQIIPVAVDDATSQPTKIQLALARDALAVPLEDAIIQLQADGLDRASAEAKARSDRANSQRIVDAAIQGTAGSSSAGAVVEYEPDEESILADLLPRNVAIQIFRAMLENAASEQGSRMNAMDNATRNAGDMINRLSIQYNRTRQAAITTELVEIISGAEAL